MEFITCSPAHSPQANDTLYIKIFDWTDAKNKIKSGGQDDEQWKAMLENKCGYRYNETGGVFFQENLIPCTEESTDQVYKYPIF